MSRQDIDTCVRRALQQSGWALHEWLGWLAQKLRPARSPCSLSQASTLSTVFWWPMRMLRCTLFTSSDSL